MAQNHALQLFVKCQFASTVRENVGFFSKSAVFAYERETANVAIPMELLCHRVGEKPESESCGGARKFASFVQCKLFRGASTIPPLHLDADTPVNPGSG